MPRRTTEFGKKFKEMFSYKGKLTKECMGKELWNKYCTMKSKETCASLEHKQMIEEHKAERKIKRITKLKQMKEIGDYLKTYCKEYTKIENYDKALEDKFIGWQLHHRLETHNSDGERRLVGIGFEELIALDMYYNRPAEELVLMRMVEHRRLHTIGKPSNRRKL